MNTLDAWYDHLDADRIMEWIQGEVRAGRLGKREANEAAEDIAKARTRDHLRVASKRADEIDGELRIVADPPLIVPIEDLAGSGTSSEAIEKSIRGCSSRTGVRSDATTIRSRSSSTCTRRARSSASAASGRRR